ncbi:hypothetical protein LINGRAHAP2_LOCUS11131, partial [Linum grandiflorum]
GLHQEEVKVKIGGSFLLCVVVMFFFFAFPSLGSMIG